MNFRNISSAKKAPGILMAIAIKSIAIFTILSLIIYELGYLCSFGVFCFVCFFFAFEIMDVKE